MYEEENFPKSYSPDKDLAVYRKVTVGGFATVWTTRLYIVQSGNRQEQLFYEARDSEFVPLTRWESNRLLMVGLPCEGVEQISKHREVHFGAEATGRLTIKFVPSAPCNVMTQEHIK
jgi:hypothetical protein